MSKWILISVLCCIVWTSTSGRWGMGSALLRHVSLNWFLKVEIMYNVYLHSETMPGVHWPTWRFPIVIQEVSYRALRVVIINQELLLYGLYKLKWYRTTFSILRSLCVDESWVEFWYILIFWEKFVYFHSCQDLAEKIDTTHIFVYEI